MGVFTEIMKKEFDSKNRFKNVRFNSLCQSINLFKLHFSFLLFFSLLTSYFSLLLAQSAETKFGQNRVQYKDFNFSYYESDHFVTYYYMGGQEIGKYTVKHAEDFADEISKVLDFKYRKKVDIIVYNTINDLNQTNIGIYNPDQNQGGTAKLPDSKMFVYFNGNHANLDKQIREGITRIYLDKQLSGKGVGEVIANALLLNLPDWYRKGLVSYMGENWNADMEDRLRDGIMSGRFRELTKLPNEESIFVGHSIWHYVEEVYGKNAVANLLYLTRINRSVDNGFLFALGTNTNETLQNWYKYYVNRFNSQIKVTLPPDEGNLVKKKEKKETDYYQAHISPNGKFVTYASNNIGRYKIHLKDLETNKTKVIYRGGWRTKTQWTDQSIPLIAWTPKSDKLSFIYDKRAVIRLTQYDMEKKKKETSRIEKFQKVFSFSYAGDSKKAVLSAMQKGQTDVFLYTIPSQTVRQITDDYYDDLQPVYVEVNGENGILFASNREDDTLRKAKYESQVFDKHTDLFFYNLDYGDNVLYRITKTPGANESNPQPFSAGYYSYLSEANGIRNHFIGKLETVFDHNQKTYRFLNKETEEEDSITLPESVVFDSVFEAGTVTVKSVTDEKVYRTQGKNAQISNFSSGVWEQSFAIAKNVQLLNFLKKGKSEFYSYPLDTSITPSPQQYTTTEYIKKTATEANKIDSEKVAKKELIAEESKPKNYTGQDFQSEFDYGVKLFDWDSVAAKNKTIEFQNGYVFKFSKVRPYFVRFMVDKAIGQLNNDLLITRYQPFNPANPTFATQPLNALFKVGITDLLENYKLYGGITIPLVGASGFSFKDLGYFLVYENLKRRWDKKITFYHQSVSNTATDYLPLVNSPILNNERLVSYSVKTNYLEVAFKYPFDVFHSIGLSGAYRNDKYVIKSTDTFSLRQPNYATNWVFLKAEYVFDNTIDVMANIKQGFRVKGFAEIHKEIPTKLYRSGDATFNLPQFNKYFFVELGFDARNYLKVYKQITFATRLTMGTSLGNAKMIHYLGGLDNSLLTIRSAGNSVSKAPISTEQNYVFQTLITPMRGFVQNSRNGTSYAVLNAELRIPLFTVLANRPPRSEFIRNFQIVGFADAGTAWEGLNPFSNNNPLFIETYSNTVSNVRIKKYKTPVVMGMGFGLRTSLLGYFIKFDTAWGLDTGEWSTKPIYYLSFGYDF